MGPRTLKKWVDRAVEMGAKAARIVPASSVTTAEWVRMKCRFGCGGWNGCLMCPPHSPRPEETARMFKDYRWAVLFERGRGASRDLAQKLERLSMLQPGPVDNSVLILEYRLHNQPLAPALDPIRRGQGRVQHQITNVSLVQQRELARYVAQRGGHLVILVQPGQQRDAVDVVVRGRW